MQNRGSADFCKCNILKAKGILSRPSTCLEEPGVMLVSRLLSGEENFDR
jgi:hypothetical protein